MLPDTITPDLLKSFELFKLRARRAYLGTRQGGHLSIKRGHGIEFSDYRQYELGDNPRHIDWGLYARSERLYVKRYQEEQNLTVLLIVDASASMFTPAGDKKWEMARDLALSLSYIALMEQDSVSVSVPGHFHSPVYFGGRAFHQVARELMQVKGPAAHDVFQDEVRRSVSRIRFPGIAILLSDFLMPLPSIESAVTILRSRSLDITAVQILGSHDLEPFAVGSDAIAVDSETSEEIQISLSTEQKKNYDEYLAQHNTSLRNRLTEARISFVSVTADTPLRDVVINSLPRTGLLA